MKVLLVSSSSGSRGGGEIFLLYLAEALIGVGMTPMLWCSDHQRMNELSEKFPGVVVRDPYPNSYHDRRLRSFGTLFARRFSIRIARRWRELGVDIIHLNKQTLEDGLDLVSAADLSELPTVVTVHMTQLNKELGALGGTLRDWLARKALKKVRRMAFTAVSDSRRREFESFVGRPVKTIYNAVSEVGLAKDTEFRSKFISEIGWPSDCLVAVCVARLVKQKDPFRFLRLAQALHARDSRWRFVWVGDGDLREHFLLEAKDLGIEREVACTGWLSEPYKFISISDLYLHSALYEGLPLAILEAMSAGLPCAISQEIVDEARPFDASSVIICDETSDTWIENATSASKRREIAKESRRLYEEHFTPQIMAKKFMNLYIQKVSEFR